MILFAGFLRICLVGIFLWFATLTNATSASAISCEKWNTNKFFKRADLADVSRCLDAGADPNARNKHGGTPLHYAASYTNTPAIITTLLDAGADPNARDKDELAPLHDAAGYTKTPAVITILLNAGADLNARDVYGLAPLHYAAAHTKRVTLRSCVWAELKKAAHPAEIGLSEARSFST